VRALLQDAALKQAQGKIYAYAHLYLTSDYACKETESKIYAMLTLLCLKRGSR